MWRVKQKILFYLKTNKIENKVKKKRRQKINLIIILHKLLKVINLLDNLANYLISFLLNQEQRIHKVKKFLKNAISLLTTKN